jgi:hypothetical protein
MTYLMDYDHQTGDIRGFYTHSTPHPDGCVEITTNVWQALLAGYTRFRLTLPAPNVVIDAMDSFYPSDPQPVDGRSDAQKILDELCALDAVLPRCTEDLIDALQLDPTLLPSILQDRLARKKELRNALSALQ